MSALTVAGMRQRVAAALEALVDTTTNPAGQWHESRWGYDALPSAEPSTWAHLTFAVAVPVTSYDAPLESRRREGSGAVSSQVAVRWVYRIRASSQVTDYDAALAAEQHLVAGLLGADLTDLHLTVTDLARRTVDGWLVGEIRAVSRHRIAPA